MSDLGINLKFEAERLSNNGHRLLQTAKMLAQHAAANPVAASQASFELLNEMLHACAGVHNTYIDGRGEDPEAKNACDAP